MQFYLGTHRPEWLSRCDVPLMVSDTTLRERRTLPRAAGTWVLDSGGYTEIARHGRWREPAAGYAARVARYAAEVGGLTWAAPQDWVCQPWAITGGQMGSQSFVGTGLSVAEHQTRTVASLLELRALAAPGVHFIPMLQGGTAGEFAGCAAAYAAAGVDLAAEPVVGIGSVAGQQGDPARVGPILAAVAEAGVTRVHGFGFKIKGLRRFAWALASADSMAWSFDARMGTRLPTCTHRAAKCGNCLAYALRWRAHLLDTIRWQQPSLFA